jgi:hypothetical protein
MRLPFFILSPATVGEVGHFIDENFSIALQVNLPISEESPVHDETPNNQLITAKN